LRRGFVVSSLLAGGADRVSRDLPVAAVSALVLMASRLADVGVCARGVVDGELSATYHPVARKGASSEETLERDPHPGKRALRAEHDLGVPPVARIQVAGAGATLQAGEGSAQMAWASRDQLAVLPPSSSARAATVVSVRFGTTDESATSPDGDPNAWVTVNPVPRTFLPVGHGAVTFLGLIELPLCQELAEIRTRPGRGSAHLASALSRQSGANPVRSSTADTVTPERSECGKTFVTKISPPHSLVMTNPVPTSFFPGGQKGRDALVARVEGTVGKDGP
jgi:hypothetical protein